MHFFLSNLSRKHDRSLHNPNRQVFSNILYYSKYYARSLFATVPPLDMYTKMVPNLIAVLSILVALVLSVTSQTSSTTLGPLTESEYVPEHDCSPYAISHSQEQFGAEFVSYAHQDREQVAERKVQTGVFLAQIQSMKSLLLEVLATPGSRLNATVIMQVMLRADQIQKKAKELEVMFNCPEGVPFSFDICDILPKMRENYGAVLSTLLPYLDYAMHLGFLESRQAPGKSMEILE